MKRIKIKFIKTYTPSSKEFSNSEYSLSGNYVVIKSLSQNQSNIGYIQFFNIETIDNIYYVK